MSRTLRDEVAALKEQPQCDTLQPKPARIEPKPPIGTTSVYFRGYDSGGYKRAPVVDLNAIQRRQLDTENRIYRPPHSYQAWQAGPLQLSKVDLSARYGVKPGRLRKWCRQQAGFPQPEIMRAPAWVYGPRGQFPDIQKLRIGLWNVCDLLRWEKVHAWRRWPAEGERETPRRRVTQFFRSEELPTMPKEDDELRGPPPDPSLPIYVYRATNGVTLSRGCALFDRALRLTRVTPPNVTRRARDLKAA